MNVDIAWRLEGDLLPAVTLPSTDGSEVAIDRLLGHWTVLYTYPKNMTNMPGMVPPAGWLNRPGCPG